jgi:hypothetical protein
VLSTADQGSIGELALRPRLPGSAVALLLRPWTFASRAMPAVPSTRWDAQWLAGAEALRASGWRVVAVEGGDELPSLWPDLLATTTGIRR